jgi:hypothetical protein
MPENFGRTEPYKEGELNVTPETAEASVEKVITPTQKEMSEAQERRFEVDGNIFVYSYNEGSGISAENKARFPEAKEVGHLSGQVKVGEAVKKLDVKRAINTNKEVMFVGTIDDKPVPTDIAQQLYEKYTRWSPTQGYLQTPKDHYRNAGEMKANEERDLEVRVGEEPWKGLL